MKNIRITNKEAKRLLANQNVIKVKCSAIDSLIDSDNYYNSGLYGWNYSIGYNNRLNAWIICGYQIPSTLFNGVNSVVEMSQSEVRV